MIKQLILLIQLLGLFFYHLIFSGDLTVTQKIPESISTGSEAVVEITINKNDLTGFAKIQETFPDGFIIEPVETKGATFSFKDNKIKFIWMALPAENEFTISYKVKPYAKTIGSFTIDGKFSYIADSERKNIEIVPATFSVVNELVSENNDVNENNIEEPAVESTKTSIQCNRTVENIENGKYKVTLEFDKKNIQGFAKITERIPEGFTASENDSKGGVFSFKDKEVKVLWMALPQNESFSVVYDIEAENSIENGNYTISGYFSYLENAVTNKYDIHESNFELNVEHLADLNNDVETNKTTDTSDAVDNTTVDNTTVDNTTVDNTTVDNTTVDNTTVDNTTVDNTTVDNIINTTEDNTSTANNDVTSVPNPETGVSYKVQVGAGHKRVSNNYFLTRFNLKDNVSTINHEGWIKYLVGSFNVYKQA